MNKQEVMEMLKSKGFDVQEMEDGITASLNRNLIRAEIYVALDFKVEYHQLFQVANNVIGIVCMDEDEQDDIPDCFGTHQYYDIG